MFEIIQLKPKLILTAKVWQKILDRFERDETYLNKSGERVTEPFRKILRKQMGMKEDYTKLTLAEKMDEAKKRITEDFKVSSHEIKNRNPIEYLLDRSLDPLDPMNVVYKEILKQAGAVIDDESKTVKLTPFLKMVQSMDVKELTMLDRNLVISLPYFKGYTVDSRLKEFRRIIPQKAMDHIRFDSRKGHELIEEIKTSKPVPLVDLAPGRLISGKYLGAFPVDWPLTNDRYTQAAIQAGQEVHIVTLPKDILNNVKPSQTITLKGTKQGVDIAVKVIPSKKMRL